MTHETMNKDAALFQSLREVCPQVEGLAWDAIVSHSRHREMVDARNRIVGAYYSLTSAGKINELAELLDHDRCTIIHARRSHDWLLRADFVYRRKYTAILKAVQDRLEILKAQYTITQNEETMFTSTISGKLGRDAEVITLRDKSYYKINVAIDGKGKDAPTTWVQVLYYKSDNSRLGEHLRSGAGIVAQGRLEVKAFNKRDGGTGIDITLWADTLELTKYAEKTASRSGYNDEDSF